MRLAARKDISVSQSVRRAVRLLLAAERSATE
jgi:hypothetical protein